MVKRTVFLVVTVVTLSACATRYQPLGYGGGYSHVQFDANTYKVSFRGNALISPDRVESYLMYRLAELTAETGHDYFIIVSGRTDARQSAVTTPGTYTSTTTGSAMMVGNTAYGSATTAGTFTPGETIVFTKHQGTAVIKMFRGQKPADNPNAFIATEVLKYLGPSIDR